MYKLLTILKVGGKYGEHTVISVAKPIGGDTVTANFD
jgi:hypothetical protein